MNTRSLMKYLFNTFALLLSGVCCLAHAADNILVNSDFKQQKNGRFDKWLPLNGTTYAKDDTGMVLKNAKGPVVMIQHIRPQGGKIVTLSVELMSPEDTQVRSYIEHSFTSKDGKPGGRSSGAVWHDAPAGKWVKITGDILIEKEYKHCYFVVGSKSGKPMYVRNPEVQVLQDTILRNTDFKIKYKGKVTNWHARGKNPKNIVFGDNGTVRIADAFIIQTDLPFTGGKTYEVSFEVRGEPGASYRGYSEWWHNTGGKRQCSTRSTGWEPAPADWTTVKFQVAIPVELLSAYVVFGAKDAKYVEIRNPQIKLVKQHEDLGGVWNAGNNKFTDNGLVITGRKGHSILKNIPIQPGKKYAITYDAKILSLKNPDGSPFFRVRSSIVPGTGIAGGTSFNDVLHAGGNLAQKRSHVFTIPADWKHKMIHFYISGHSDGEILVNNFALEEVVVKDSDSWSYNLTKPFCRDSFYPGDKHDTIEGVADAKGADSVKVSVGGKSAVAAVKNGKAEFALPFNGKDRAQFKIDFIKNGKVEKSFTTEIRVLPPAPNMVVVTPNRGLLFNGKPFFPVYLNNHKTFSDAGLYYSARNGANILTMHISHEELLLERLDLVHKYGMKMIVYPSPPTKVSGLKRFKENLERCITPKVMAHPAFFGYLHFDEPLLAGVPIDAFQGAYKIMKEHSPYHLVWVNAAPRNEIPDLKPYADASDIFGVDIYPVPIPNGHSGIADKTLNCVGTYTRRMLECGSMKRAAWIYLQGFAWHECSADPNAPKKPYPTLTESRFMAYDVLVNGGNGYFIWGTGHVREFKFFHLLYKVMREMHQISGLFDGNHQMKEIKTANPEIRCTEVIKDGKKFFVVMNKTDQNQSAVIPELKGKILLSSGGKVTGNKADLPPWEIILVSEHQLPAPLWQLPPKNEKLEKLGDPREKTIRDEENYRLAPRYNGNANWIWYKDGQHGLSTCWLGKEFTAAGNEKVIVQVTADDYTTLYVNGELVFDEMTQERKGWGCMAKIDISKKIKPGKNLVVVKGSDAGAAPCGALIDLQVGNKSYNSDTSWKVIPAYKGDKVPTDFSKAANAVLVAPYGGGAWGRGVRVFNY